ncbi:hypothetical protein ABZ353_26360 [Streptomyces niveus]|uniref:hypothetical protein n=1 Tax=Streptomyces niveus TaxID=193462 RepID=UPI0034001DED
MLHHHYVTEDELAAFETDIRQEHRAVASGLRDAYRLGRFQDDAEEVGRKILTGSEQAVVGLTLRQIDKRWIARGTLHALANLSCRWDRHGAVNEDGPRGGGAPQETGHAGRHDTGPSGPASLGSVGPSGQSP